jgi:hypothetical protein
MTKKESAKKGTVGVVKTEYFTSLILLIILFYPMEVK